MTDVRRRMKRLAAPIASRLGRPRGGLATTILCYHGVSQDACSDNVSVEQFTAQMEMLAARYEIVSMRHVSNWLDDPAAAPLGAVAITFDDGYRSVVELALPVLQSLDLTAAAFVLPGRWGEIAEWNPAPPSEARQLWTEEDLGTWVAAGMEVGSHGMTHLDVTAAPIESAHHEIYGSRHELLDLGVDPIGFCYPWGRHDPRVRDMVKASGYPLAVAGGYGRYHSPQDRFALRRMTVDPEDRCSDLAAKLAGGYDWLDRGTARRTRR